MRDGLLSALALCRKAGKLAIGFDAAEEALRGGAPLGVLASDAAERTQRNLRLACGDGAETVCLGRTMQEIESAVGRRFAAAAVCDKGLAELIKKKLGENQGG